MGAGVGPVFGCFAETGFDGILAKVGFGVLVVVEVANVTVVIVTSPDRAFTALGEIDLASGKGFPALDDAVE